MSAVVANVGSWRVAVAIDYANFHYEPIRWLESQRPARAGPDLPASVHAAVEVRRALGGRAPRALLGGSYIVLASPFFEVKVAVSAPLSASSARAATGLLEHPLVPGLPPEFADGVMNGLRRDTELDAQGRVVIEQAGYDEVESSAYAFEWAATLLKWALLSNDGRAPSTTAVETFVATWQY